MARARNARWSNQVQLMTPKWVLEANGYAIFGTGSEGLVSTPGPQNQSRMQSVKDE